MKNTWASPLTIGDPLSNFATHIDLMKLITCNGVPLNATVTSKKEFMINYRVQNIVGLVEQLKADGV